MIIRKSTCIFLLPRGVDSVGGGGGGGGEGMRGCIPLDLKWGGGCTIIPPGFSDENKSLEIETENEISTFLALIICKASSFKIVWSNNFYIKYVLRF